MKTNAAFAVAVFVLTIQNKATAYRTDIEANSEASFCEYRKHLTFKPTATCCANQVIKPGLDITKYWDKCVPTNGQSNTVEEIGWSIYSCILKKASGKDQLSLREFADLITSSYPDEIKSKINAEIDSQTVPAATLDNHARLEKLRVTYYDIEKEVCEGMPSESKSYGKIEMCSALKEENHRAGMCCSKSYPVDIRYRSLFDAGGAESMKKCREVMHKGLDEFQMNSTDMMENSLLEICDVACAMDEIGGGFSFRRNVIDNRNYWEFELFDHLGKYPIIPKFLSPGTIQEVTDYLNSTFKLNDTIEAMRNHEFADVVGGDSNTQRPVHNLAWVHRGVPPEDKFKYEFMGRRFHRGILHVAIFCATYRELITRTEYFIFKNCKPEDVTEAPAEQLAAEPTDAPAPAPEAVTEPPAAVESGVTEAPAA